MKKSKEKNKKLEKVYEKAEKNIICENSFSDNMIKINDGKDCKLNEDPNLKDNIINKNDNLKENKSIILKNEILIENQVEKIVEKENKRKENILNTKIEKKLQQKILLEKENSEKNENNVKKLNFSKNESKNILTQNKIVSNSKFIIIINLVLN